MDLTGLINRPEVWGTDRIAAVPALPATGAFLIDDQESVHVVESGTVDLFTVEMRDGVPFSARQHFIRIRGGEIICGIAKNPANSLSILALPGPGTTIRRITFRDLQGDIAVNPCYLELVDKWIENVSVGTALKVVPKNILLIEPGANLTLSEGSKVLLPRAGVVWVCLDKAPARYLGIGSVPPRAWGETFFPVTRAGWIELDDNSELTAISTTALAALGIEWRVHLELFHSTVLDHLSLTRDQRRRQDVSRLRNRIEAAAVGISTAILQLASPLNGSAAAANVESDAVDSILIAAQAVGKELGIRIKPHPDLLRGLTLEDPVGSIANASGVRSRRVLLRDGWWKQDNGPILAFRDTDQRPVALLTHSPGSYKLFDPVDRTSVRVTQSLAMTLNGFAYSFYRPFPSRSLSALDLLRFGAAHAHGDLLTVALMGTASGLLALVTPIATGIIFDSVIPGALRTQLFTLVAFAIVCALSTACFNIARGFATLRLEGKMDAAIQAAVWDRLLSLPVPFFRDYSSGDLATRSMGINQIRQALTGSTLASILSGVFSIFSFVLLFFYSWVLALVATALIGFAFLCSTGMGYLQMRHQRKVFHLRGTVSGIVVQFIRGIPKLRVSATENRAFSAWARQFAAQKQTSMAARKISNRLTVFNSAFPVFCMAAIFYSSAALLSSNGSFAVTPGEFLAFNAAFVQFLMSSLLLSSSLVAALGCIPLYERAAPIVRTCPEVSEAKASPGELSGGIEVNHVTFRYHSGSPAVLRDVSLSILPGQFVALVGASGCGKSTLFRLLLGFERPESGALYFDGQDLTGIDVQAVRQQMGVVLQNSTLLSGDVFTNIVGASTLTIDDAWEAARLAGLDQDIKNMPMGMHTALSEGGGGLSGGQRQRLLIARAIVRKPRIIFFDEATSALDNKTQATVSRSLEALRATRVVIAHRLSTIVNADRIYVLDKGSVVQAGTYAELAGTEGLFRELAKRQIV